MKIVAIPELTSESEARKRELQEIKKHRVLSIKEDNELLALEMRQFWNCEC